MDNPHPHPPKAQCDGCASDLAEHFSGVGALTQQEHVGKLCDEPRKQNKRFRIWG